MESANSLGSGLYSEDEDQLMQAASGGASDQPIRKVVLEKGRTGLDFSIKGGEDYNIPIVISRVFAGGVAEKTGQINSGDEIISVNGKNIVGATHADAVAALKKAGNTVNLELRSNPKMREALENAERKVASRRALSLERKTSGSSGLTSATSGTVPVAAAVVVGTSSSAAAAHEEPAAPAAAKVTTTVTTVKRHGTTTTTSVSSGAMVAATSQDDDSSTTSNTSQPPVIISDTSFEPEDTVIPTSASSVKASSAVYATPVTVVVVNPAAAPIPQHEDDAPVYRPPPTIVGVAGTNLFDQRRAEERNRTAKASKPEFEPQGINAILQKEEMLRGRLGPFPDGWECKQDPETRRFYFLNHLTKRTTWIDPRSRTFRKDSIDDCVGDELPYGWQRWASPDTYVYYLNHLDSTTHWEHPRKLREHEQVLEIQMFIMNSRGFLESKRVACERRYKDAYDCKARITLLQKNKTRNVDGHLTAAAIEEDLQAEQDDLQQIEADIARLNLATSEFERRLLELDTLNNLLATRIVDEQIQDIPLSQASKVALVRSERGILYSEDVKRINVEQQIEAIRSEISGDPEVQVTPYVAMSPHDMATRIGQDVRGTAVEIELERLLIKFEVELIRKNTEQLHTFLTRIQNERRHISRLQMESPGIGVAIPDWILSRPWKREWREIESVDDLTEETLHNYRIRGTVPEQLRFEEKLEKLKLLDD